MTHGIITILHQSKRPVLFVKETPLPVSSVLLPFGAGQPSKEALFVAAYYSARYGSQLNLLMVSRQAEKDEALSTYAHTYLEKLGVNASYSWSSPESFTTDVVSQVEALGVSTLILGGDEYSSILDRVFSQEIDEILTRVKIPVMICQ